MRKKYRRNDNIAICGTPAAIAEAEAILDVLDGLESELNGRILQNEGDIRLTIQDAIDACNIKAVIMVGGNMVYPFDKTVKQYEQLKRSGVNLV